MASSTAAPIHEGRDLFSGASMRAGGLFFLVAAAACAQRTDPTPLLLWPEGAPGAVGGEDVDKPAMTPWLPANPNGQAVVVFPGGGYRGLAMDHEGRQIAQWLNSQGIAAFVVKYRLGPRYHHPAMINDAQRAIRTVRSRATEWKVDPRRIGVWGFSAGGHLASTVATHFDSGKSDASDSIDRAGSRPDFAILSYPVLTLTDEPYVHKSSRQNLLGDNPDPKLLDLLSNEKQVTRDTPPTFLFHTNEDRGVPAENSVLFYLALRKQGVPAELHIYEKGPHGVGLASTDLALSSWGARLADWLRRR